MLKIKQIAMCNLNSYVLDPTTLRLPTVIYFCAAPRSVLVQVHMYTTPVCVKAVITRCHEVLLHRVYIQRGTAADKTRHVPQLFCHAAVP